MSTEDTSSDRIRETRKARGLTLREAAQQVGVTLTTFARWERGERDPSRGPLLVYRSLQAWLREGESR